MDGACDDIKRRVSHKLTFALLCSVIVPQLGLGMSVPAIPLIAGDLNIDIASAQATLIIYMLGYALSMLLAGLLSDRYGPKQVQIWGLILAGVGAAVCALSPNLFIFAATRFAQALGGCVGTVTARLIVGSEYAPKDRMKVLTILASAIAITPCLAPLLGGILIPFIGWRGVFVAIAIIGAVVLAIYHEITRDLTHTPRRNTRLSDIGAIYYKNMLMPRFMLYATAISFVWMSYFTFVSCSPNALQVRLGLSATTYGFLLAGTALGYVAGSIITRKLSARYDIDEMMVVGSIVGLAGGIILIVSSAIYPVSVIAIVIPSMLILLAVGMIIPASQAGLLKYVTQEPGTSSGLFFFLQMIAGASYAAIGNSWHNLEPTTFAILVALPSIALPFLLWGGLLRAQRTEHVADS